MSILERRSLRILVNIFHSVSSNVIGLVLLMLYSQLSDLGIGYMDSIFHSRGVIPELRILLNSWDIYCRLFLLSFLMAMYGIPEGPGADVLDRD